MLADLQGNGVLDIVFGDTDGFVHAVDPLTGAERPGFPKSTDPLSVTKPVHGRPLGFEELATNLAVGDLDGDGRLWIVGASERGKVYVWDASGRRRTGWPRTLDAGLAGVFPPPIPRTSPGNTPAFARPPTLGAFASPTLYDLTGDGRLEVIAAGWDGHLHVMDADGQPLPGWPVKVEHGDGEVASSPVFSPSYLFDGDASLMTTYGPAPDQGEVADVLADPTLLDGGLLSDAPVSFTTTGAFGRAGPGGQPLVYAQAGSNAASIAAGLLTAGSGQPVENVERAYLAAGGSPLAGFPGRMQDLNFLGAPLFVDATGDGIAEIVDGGDSSALHAYAVVPDPGAGLPLPTPGTQAQGFPKFTTGWTLWSPAAGDLDSDGDVEIVSLTREGYLMVWETPGLTSANGEWWSYHHDEWNTGRYGSDTRPPGTLRDRLWQGAPEASFTAPGDDWYSGTVAEYHAFFDGAEPVSFAPSGPAGSTQSIPVPPGTQRVWVQALDDAGNRGPKVEFLPEPGDAGALLGGLLVLSLRWIRRRRSFA